MSEAVAAFKSFQEVHDALQQYVNTNGIPIVRAPHRNMWEMGDTLREKYNYFVTQDAIPHFKILVAGQSQKSNIILALEGRPPFDGSTFMRMPPGNGVRYPYLAQAVIDAIAAWIDNGAPFE